MGAEQLWTRFFFKTHPMEFGHPEEEDNPFLGSVRTISHYIVKDPQQYHNPIQKPL
jgi:hypothetical protein